MSRNQGKCKFGDTFCHKCGNKAYIAPVCLNQQNKEKFVTKRKNEKGTTGIEIIESIYEVTGVIEYQDQETFIDCQI